MPQPAISIQSLPRARNCGVLRSISKLGSVYGKKCGRKRTSVSGESNCLKKNSTVPLRSATVTFLSTYKPSIWWNVGLCVASSSSRRNTRPGTTTRIGGLDRKSTRLNSSHTVISYAVFCLKKKNRNEDEL